MTTTTDTIERAPLSERTGPLLNFLGLLRYPDGAGKEQRFEGDWHLLGLLDEQLRVRSMSRLTVGDLPEDVLRAAAEQVETLRYGRWKLSGEDGQPILERLDAHFRPLQEAQAAHRREQAKQLERQARENEVIGEQVAAANAAEFRQIWGLPA